MGQLSTTRLPEGKSNANQPQIEQDDVKGFYDELISNPVFNGRFKNVPLMRILSMAREVLYFFRNARNEKVVKSFKEIFDMHSLMYISEAEIDTFFELFIEHFHMKSEDCWHSFEQILDYIKTMLFDPEKEKLLIFYKEIKRNPILHRKFKKTSPYCLMKVINEIYWCLEKRKPDWEMESIQDIHRMMNITEEDYDEFVELFFDIYCPDICYRMKAGPIFLKIKNAMVGKPFQRIVAFRKTLKNPIQGRKFDIPEIKLIKMCSQMVDVVLHPKSHDMNAIGLSHQYFNITGEEYDEFIRRFLEICNMNDNFVLKAKKRFKKLKLIVCEHETKHSKLVI